MAKYMLMFVGDDEWRETHSKEEIERGYAEIGKWWGELSAKGVIKAGEELGSAREATTVRRVNGKMAVTDGPFIESKENVGGFALIEVPDLDAAIAVAKGWPGGDVEVRPVVEH
ncbi:MAG TPA: YciI family protein [Candidatus Limnocylindria bacterium]|jgi:hypothetical protein|nr:YciI family protein [Candidatus Limnocylindria bacterium]